MLRREKISVFELPPMDRDKRAADERLDDVPISFQEKYIQTGLVLSDDRHVDVLSRNDAFRTRD